MARVRQVVHAVATLDVPCWPGVFSLRTRGRPLARDWLKHPAVVDVPAPKDGLYALSDIHGDAQRAARLLERHDIVSVHEKSGKVAWLAGHAVLVVVGDSIDKGPSSLGAIDFLRALQAAAREAGGRVVVLMGNHEAEFLANPTNSKANGPHGINREIRAMGQTPKAFAHSDPSRGAWLRTLPFGARVGDWFFAHGGDTKGRSLCALDQYLEESVEEHGFATSALVGHASILRRRNWYRHDATTGARYSAALGTHHIVFGHDPGGLGPKGRIAVGQGGSLLRIDTGMSRGVGYSHGALLSVHRKGHHESVHTCGANGEKKLLFACEVEAQ